jgi:hypothetical protein
MYGKVCGAYGRAFDDDTKKQVFITIVESPVADAPKVLFSQKYTFKGVHIGWDADWDDEQSLYITIKNRVGQSSEVLKKILLKFSTTNGLFYVAEEK